MIVITEVAKKLENILNGKDTETQSLTNPADYDFVVYTEGFHLDRIYDQKSGKNFIPVFVSSMGGQYNPVQRLKQANYTIPVVIYFPVRFKNDFFVINDFLADALVGANLNYGTLSGKAISNISVSQYGEIQELDLDQFNKWIQDKYRTAINVHEPWMSLQFTLYLSQCNGGVMGNDVTTTITFTRTSDNKTFTLENPLFNQASIQSQSQATSQQALGENEVEGLPFGTNYGCGFSLFVQDNTFFTTILKEWFDGNIQQDHLTINIQIVSQTFQKQCYIESVNMPIVKGQPVTITFAFAKRVSS